MTVQVFPPDSTDPFAAILAIGDSWFWYPKNSLLASILALKQLHPDYKTAHILGKNGALLSDYRTGKFAAMWRNELTAQNFRFSLVLISGGGNDSVDYAFGPMSVCMGIMSRATHAVHRTTNRSPSVACPRRGCFARRIDVARWLNTRQKKVPTKR